MKISPIQRERHRIEMSNDVVARHRARKLGRSQLEIAAAIEKVGDNLETVCEELGA
jgi:hypothetical protein